MAYKGRRVLDRFLLLGTALAVGFVGLFGAAVGDSERIGSYWASASVDPDGVAQVAEVIDYDFGSNSRHGIFRDVPLLDPTAPISVESPTAPDQFIIESAGTDTRLRIGDPDATVSNRHRYRIDYPIFIGMAGGGISWNAVGAGWPVSISDVEIHLAVASELTNLRCSEGQAGSWDPCTVTQPEPGHLVVQVDKLDSFEGITVTATPAGALSAAPALPAAPTGDAQDPGTGLLPPAVGAAALAALAAAVASVFVRKAGREYVWAGGSADAAFGPQFGEQFPVRLVDHDELHKMASTEFAPPKGITAWQGGVLYKEGVSEDQQVAWLLERAIAGEVEIEGTDDDLTIRLLEVDSTEPQALNALFGGRNTIKLGKYDEQFAGGWTSLNKRLKRWHADSEYWDPQGESRRTRTLFMGVPLALIGVVGVLVSAILANRLGTWPLIGVALFGLAAGAGLSMLIRSWELRVRTPEGSGLWILIESFRRFIHNSDAQHVDAAAKQGLLRDYTAWAVALGEVDRWTKAVEQAEKQGTAIDPGMLYFAHAAPNLRGAASSAATAPSKSGSGGGGVGGGGGGGGGGSW